MEGHSRLTVQPNLLKELNKTAIKRVLMQKAEATRVEISAMTGISQPTVNAIISELVSARIVVEKGLTGSSGGRKAAVYELNTAYAHAIVLVVEQSKLRYQVIDLVSNICEEHICPRTAKEDICRRIVQTVTELQASYDNVQALVIGVPGSVDQEGVVYAIPDIPEFEEFALGKTLASALSMQVKIMNDINATALGYVNKSYPESHHMIYLHVGNGLGAGLIADSRLLLGAGCFAGEIGFMQLGTDEYMLEETFHGQLEQSGYDKIARVTINLISLFNPSLVVIGGSCAEKKLCRYVETICSSRFPRKMMPKIEMCSDAENYYIQGLSRTAMELCNRDIRLV